MELHEAQSKLSELMPKVVEGTEIILTESGVQLARIVPIPQTNQPRIPDLHPGAIETSEDFDEPLPDEFWTGSE
jgi:prevent-host-death family protein